MADTTVYVDIGLSTGSNDGTSWANAYQNVTGANSMQTAMDTADDLISLDVMVKISGEKTEIAMTGTTLTLLSGGSVVSLTPQTNNWVKIIGCDSSGNPITARGTRIKITADNSQASLVDFTGNATRVGWYNFEFDGDGISTNGFYHTNAGSISTGFFYIFANCSFHGSTNYQFYCESWFRGCIFFDCDFPTSYPPVQSNPVFKGFGGVWLNCKFSTDYTYSVHVEQNLGTTFYNSIFDGEGCDHLIRLLAGYHCSFIKCAFVNFDISAIQSDLIYIMAHVIDCYFEGITPASDSIMTTENSDDSLNVVGINCASNLVSGLLDGADMLLSPYRTAANILFDNESDCTRISASNNRLKDRELFHKGMPDQFGNRGTIGPEHMNAIAEAKLRRHHV